MRIILFAVWGFVCVVVLSVVGVYITAKTRLAKTPMAIYGEVPDFKLTNQLGRAFSLADLKGDVWVADIIFTRCPGPCLTMTRTMQAVQAALPAQSAVKLVSLTADPEYDSPAVLRDYASRFTKDLDRWQFLTGPKQDVYRLAMAGFKLAVEQNNGTSPEADPFIHSTRFVLIDRHGRLRGVPYDGTEKASVSKIVKAASQLAQELTP